jgi:hypothetical protein
MKNRTSISMEGEEMPRHITLDVGCGDFPRGDVNVDLQCGNYKNVQWKGIPNFIKCSIDHLPFANRTFSFVNCSHTIEHVDKPFLALKELVRVADRHVVIHCPHRFGWNSRGDKNRINRSWFVSALTNLQAQFEPLYFRTGISRKRTFLFFVPEEIEVEVFRGKA